LSKIPLTFGSPGLVYASNHRTVPLRLAPVTGALLHFKFFSDFHERVMTELTESRHFDGSSEYARYAEALGSEPELSFAFPGSVRFTGSADLTARGLMRSSPDYDAFRAKHLRSKPEADMRRELADPIGIT
jgi:hypothetical protein